MANLISIALEAKNASGPAFQQARADLAALKGDLRGIPQPRINAAPVVKDLSDIKAATAAVGVQANTAAGQVRNLSAATGRIPSPRINTAPLVKDLAAVQVATAGIGAQASVTGGLLRAMGDSARGALANLGPAGQALSNLTLGAGALSVAAGAAGVALGALAAASVVVSAARGFAAEVQQVELLAERTGIAVEDVQVLQRVLTNAGVSADAFVRPLERLNRELQANSSLVQQLGLDRSDPLTALRQLMGILAAAPDIGKRNEIANRLMGQSFGELISVAKVLGTTFDETKQKMQGGLFDAQRVAETAALRKEVADLGTEWSNVWTGLQAATVVPATAIVAVLGWITEKLTAVSTAALQVSRIKIFDGTDLGKLVTQGLQLLAPLDALRRGVIAAAEARDRLAKQAAGIDPASGLMKAHGGLKPEAEDNLKGITLEDEKAAKESPRARQIRELQELLRGTKADATALADALGLIDRDTKLIGIAERIKKETGNLPAAVLAALPAEARESLIERYVLGPKGLPPISEQVRAHLASVSAAFDEFEQRLQASNSAGGLGAATSLLRPADAAAPAVRDLSTLKDAARSVAGSIEGAFSNVFVNITNDAQTLKGAIVSIFTAMRDEILSILGSLAARSLLSLIPGVGPLLGGITAARPAGALAASGGLSIDVESLIPAGTRRATGARQTEQGEGDPARSGSVVNNYHVTALDSRSFADSIRSPYGAINQTTVRGLEIAARGGRG